MSGECWWCLEHVTDCKCFVNPPHYKGQDMQAIDVIEAFGLGFNLGNVIKYVLRAGKKGDKREDLKKAKWYLEREINGL